MPRRALATLVVFAAGLSLGACGADESVSDVVPKTTPELTVPSDTTALGASVPTTTTSTTSTTTTSTTAAPATGTPSAPVTTTPQGTGGTPSSGATGTSTTGGTGGFDDFCQQNPGAC